MMTVAEILDHVKDVQRVELSRVAYKLTTFIASAILAPLILWALFGLVNTLADIRKEAVEVRLLLVEVRAAVQHQFTDADNMKAQVKELSSDVKGLRDDATRLITLLDRSVKVKRAPSR
jgi:hypothetical protein